MITTASRLLILFSVIILGGVFVILDHVGIAVPYLTRRRQFSSLPTLVSQFEHPFQPFPSNTTLFTPPLITRGRDIIDATGKRFPLHGVNYYGASDEDFVVGGLDILHRDDISKSIREMGYNSVRLPYSDELVITDPLIPKHLLKANPDLIGKHALDIYEAVVTSLTNHGLAVFINDHITTARWCCDGYPCDLSWRNDFLGIGQFCRVKQSEDQWISNWVKVMKRFVNNPMVVGVDLRNEVRALWGTVPWRVWATAAERAGEVLLEMNPNWLIVVGGVESNNDLTGVRERPVKLSIPNKVVYAAHVYSWSGWGSVEGRFARRNYESFKESMMENWAYILDEEIAPVWVNEIGAPRKPGSGDARYWSNLIKFLKSRDADFAYWAINPRKVAGHEVEWYALLKDDWKSPILDYRYADLLDLMGKKPRGGLPVEPVPTTSPAPRGDSPPRRRKGKSSRLVEA